MIEPKSDPGGLDAAALYESLVREGSGPGDASAVVRAYFDRSRELLFGWHRRGGGGEEIVRAYTALVDHLLCRLFEQASRVAGRGLGGSRSCALLAQGGYGRGELNPHSDIDLLFLYRPRLSAYVRAVAERVLYTLWDAGIQVGHAVRTIAGSMRLAASDLKVRTSLLDARYLCGDRALFGEFEQALEAYVARRNGERFIREKMAEQRRRHERYGGSVYLLEPDLKEGEGGLRDIHTASWVARARFGVKSLADLVERGVLAPRDWEALARARDFLWRLRNELHFVSDKHQDQLTFEAQERAALALGFGGNGRTRPAEELMRAYYLHAAEVSRVTSLVLHQASPPSRPSRARSAPREIREGMCVSGGFLKLSDPAVLDRRPESLIELFCDVQEHGVEIDQPSREAIRQRLGLIDEKFRRSAAANLPFFRILKWKERVYETLREMHACGVLGAFIPEFGRLLCMVSRDVYHIYTVDQHSLRLVRELERLRAGAVREEQPLLTQLAREVEKIEILYLGLLFHDIGKGFGGDHSEIGRQLVRPIARRMRLNVDDTAQLEFLILRHLDFAQTAFQRDLEDYKTIRDFAEVVRTIDNLKMLYLLTYADMRSVGPEFWNHWKASLLEELYLKTLRLLESREKGEARGEDRRALVRRTQARLRRRLSRRYSEGEVSRFLEPMPDRYFLATPESEIEAHFELLRRFGEHTLLTQVTHYPEREFTEVVVCTRDRPGLFARITGVFAALGFDILSARIITRKDGLVLDVFRISHAGRSEVLMEERRWERLDPLLARVLADQIDVQQLVKQSRRPFLVPKRTVRIPTTVEIDNRASDDFTVVEVYTQDRLGVLFTITYTLYRLGILIHLAKISTYLEQVSDVFYVTDERGRKILDETQLAAIRRSLAAALTEEDERGAQPSP